ncbi:hypothetical protein TD95_004804 [Thielaviopsis punctulata]|uniref:3-phytase n=1 Tax=Thielaviopsis punctulata TaxID=72032 RepID=A0A0F4ZIJ7_9PEZI|nr:hypothetical protein TD95_004804 [Thielaviopsis punctulata]
MDHIASAASAVHSALTARRFQYQPLSGSASAWRRFLDPLDVVMAPKNRRKLQFTLVSMASLLVFAVLIGMRYLFSSPSLLSTSIKPFIVNRSPHHPHGSSSACYDCMYMATPSLWGQYSPMFSVPSELCADVPPKCTLTFGQVLSRHGARDPTSSKTVEYNRTIQRIHDSVTEYGEAVKFLRNYTYSLGADHLTKFGQDEMMVSGVNFFQRYKSLAASSVPFIRASGQQRVVESALNWTQGFYAARVSHGIDPVGESKGKLLIIPEGDTSNNTLNNGLCTALESGKYSQVGDDAKDAFLATFIEPITARLNLNLPGANLTNKEAVYMMDLCPFNTVATADATVSEFCLLFTIEDWRNYDYYQTMDKYYGHGNGNPMGATSGVGWANELIARLTDTPVVDHTSVNHTLDSSNATFPLGRALYADFSHDNDMTGIFSALRLYDATPLLPTDRRVAPEEAGGFASSWVVPFAARMYVEKMRCEGESEEFVRFLVNDRVIPLVDCGVDKFGRCKLSKWVDTMGFAQSGGNWSECFSS